MAIHASNGHHPTYAIHSSYGYQPSYGHPPSMDTQTSCGYSATYTWGLRGRGRGQDDRDGTAPPPHPLPCHLRSVFCKADLEKQVPVSECTRLTVCPGTWHVAQEGCAAARVLQSCRGGSGHSVLPEAACVVESLSAAVASAAEPTGRPGAPWH